MQLLRGDASPGERPIDALPAIRAPHIASSPLLTLQVHSKAERYSVGFFYGPSLDTDLRPLNLAPRFTAAVRSSERHRSAGIMPLREELEQGVVGSLQGGARHRTYGDLLWGYFSRAYPENMARHYPDG